MLPKRMGAAVTFSFIVLGSALAWGADSEESKTDPKHQQEKTEPKAEQPRKASAKTAASEGTRIARNIFNQMPDPMKDLKSPLEALRWATNLSGICPNRDPKNPDPYARGLVGATSGPDFSSNDVFESMKSYVTERADPSRTPDLLERFIPSDALKRKAKFWHLQNLPFENAKHLSVFDIEKGKEACDTMKNVGDVDLVKSKAVMARSLTYWSLGNLGANASCEPVTKRTDEQLHSVLKTACELQDQLASADKDARIKIMTALGDLSSGKEFFGSSGMEAANQILDAEKEEDRRKLIKKLLDHEQISESSSLEPLLSMLIANGYIPAKIAEEIAKARKSNESTIGDRESLERKLTDSKKASVTISDGRVAFKDGSGKLFVASKDYLKLSKEMEEASKTGKLTPELKAKVFANLQEVDPKTGALTTYTPEKMVADRQAAQAAEQAKLDAEPVKPGEEKQTTWTGAKIQRGQKLRDNWNVEKIVSDPKMGKDVLLVQFKHPQFAEGAVYSWTAGPQAGWVFWRRQNPDQVCHARPGQRFICPIQVANR
jgi:hypothetical protein